MGSRSRPANPAALAFVTRYFAAINGHAPRLGPGPISVAELLATWHHRTAVNAAYLVPHGTVRFTVLGGDDRAADGDELVAMTRLVEQGLSDGAVGLSTGLEYLPGRFGGVAEVAALCAPVAAAGLPYVTHMRGYGVTGIARDGGGAGHRGPVRRGAARVALPWAGRHPAATPG